MIFNPGFAIHPVKDPMGFTYGACVFGPQVERRSLDEIRKSLYDPHCDGPETVYAIAMDVGKVSHRKIMEDLHLLYGAVTYAAGKLGREPVRSQGHIHKNSVYAGGWSTPEVYEIWEGEAIVYMQETAGDDPGRCYAVHAGAGGVVIVPPGWAHSTISASPERPLTFGAWCDRQYGFEYDDVRRHKGLAWFPFIGEQDRIIWEKNPEYLNQRLVEKPPRSYAEFDIDPEKSIYAQFEEDPDRFLFVSRPDFFAEIWKDFIP